MSTPSPPRRKTPWHVWVVGALALLCNGSGAYTIMLAQAGRIQDLGADEAAYYASQPLWFVAVTDTALVTAVAAAIALLLRNRAAVWLFAISLAAIIVTNAYDLVAETSLALLSRDWLGVTIVIAVLAILQLRYTLAMRRRAVLA